MVVVEQGRRGRRGRRGGGGEEDEAGGGGGGGGEEEKEEKEEEEEATDIKSNNPHLAGGEKSTQKKMNFFQVHGPKTMKLFNTKSCGDAKLELFQAHGLPIRLLQADTT